MIQLERVGEDGPRAYPWDRDLVLTADIRAFSVADVLNWIHSASKSGYLAFENGGESKAVYLHHGEVVFASSNLEVDRLGASLLRAGALTAEQYKSAERVYKHTGHFGKVLVDRGYLTPREIWNGVKAQVEEIVRSLFAYGAGNVLFWEGEARPDNVVRLALPTRRLIAEGLRRRDELLKQLAWLEGPSVRVRVEKECGAELTGTERALFQALGGTDDFIDACRKVGIDPLSGTRTLNHLRLTGMVTVSEASGGSAEESVPGAVGSGDGDSVRKSVEQHLQVLAELAAPVVAVEGPDGLRSRLGKVIEEASPRFPELLSGLEVGPGGTLDPHAVVERALRFPGDREREVSLAFGELLSYLEFELVNHPKIKDPELFLDAIDPLRACL